MSDGISECHPRKGLPNFFAGITGGKALRLAYFGGSITQAVGWRTQTFEEFERRFPQAGFEMIDAAIGGTGSDLGVFRVDADVIDKQPDLVFVEFAVNDSGGDPPVIARTMEGIVRKIRRANSLCDICFVYTVKEDMTEGLRNGTIHRITEVHEEVADHYGIPSIHMGLDVAGLEGEGGLVFKVPDAGEREKLIKSGKIAFARDGCHPTEEGHRIYTRAVMRSFDIMKPIGVAGPHETPSPMNHDNWEHARMESPGKFDMNGNWRKLEREDWPDMSWGDKFLPGLWGSENPGDSITIEFTGRGLGLYDVVGPACGQVILEIDGRQVNRFNRFDAYCTYYRSSYRMFVRDLEPGRHVARLIVGDERIDKKAILDERGERIDDPSRFEGRMIYPAAILVLV